LKKGLSINFSCSFVEDSFARRPMTYPIFILLVGGGIDDLNHLANLDEDV